MRRLLISILAFLCAFPTLPMSKLAHAEPSPTLYTCIFPDGPYAGQEILVRYDALDAELSLVSNNTGETVRMLETGLNTPQFEVRGWSSDCRYMIATLGIWGEQQTAAWDVVENRRVGTIETQGQRYTDLVWIPTHDNRLLIESLAGAFIWHLPTDYQALLNPFSDGYGRNFLTGGSVPCTECYWRYPERLTWDLAQNQLLTVPIDPNRDGVAAYDLTTGTEVAFYGLNPTSKVVSYRLVEGNEYIMVYVMEEPIGRKGELVIFNRSTATPIHLSANILGDTAPLAFFSSTGRYLIIRTYNLYVWDFQNLGSVAPYEPNQTLHIDEQSITAPLLDAIRTNESETAVQTVTFWYGLDFTIWQWDLATGERFYAKKYLETVCDDLSQLAPEDDVELVTWACGYR